MTWFGTLGRLCGMRLALVITVFLAAGCGCRPSPPAAESSVPVEPDPPPAIERRPPPPDLYPVQVNGKTGYLDRAGKFVLPPRWDQAGPMDGGYATVRVGGKWGLIDKTGAVRVAPRYRTDHGLENVREGLAVFRDDGGRYGFLDPAGNEVIPARFQFAQSFSEGLAVAVAADAKKVGYIDPTGRLVVPAVFDDAWPFREGFALVLVADQMAFIDRKGEFAFDRRFGVALDFAEGLAPVNPTGHWTTHYRGDFGGKWGYMDRTGRVVIEPQFRHADLFSEGLAAVNRDGEFGKWGYVGRDGRLVIDFRWDMAWPFSEGLAVVVDEHFRWGYIDRAGRVVIEPRFDEAGPFRGGLARVEIKAGDERLAGYIDRTGKYVWEPSR
jgi:hypothetical protein